MVMVGVVPACCVCSERDISKKNGISYETTIKIGSGEDETNETS